MPSATRSLLIWRDGYTTTPMAVPTRSARSPPSLPATVMSRRAGSLIRSLRSHPCCSEMRRTKELNAAFSQAKLLITPKNGERGGRLTSPHAARDRQHHGLDSLHLGEAELEVQPTA